MNAAERSVMCILVAVESGGSRADSASEMNDAFDLGIVLEPINRRASDEGEAS